MSFEAYLCVTPSRFDEEKGEWNLPAMTVERTQLPSATFDGARSDLDEAAATTTTLGTVRLAALQRDVEKENEDDARLYAKLATRTKSVYFTNRRVDKLLSDAGNGGGVGLCVALLSVFGPIADRLSCLYQHSVQANFHSCRRVMLCYRRRVSKLCGIQM